jgi:potassium-transporting ATPase KdpC subunit
VTAHSSRPVSPLDPIPDETATERPIVPPPPRPFVGHLRASLVLLLLAILLLGAGYPSAITFFAQTVVPHSADGSLITGPNGTALGSSLIAQNLSAPWLFWERPTPLDYQSFNGSPPPVGYSDPALVNETRSYMQQYGPYAVNASVPEILVTVSASGLDPDLTPEAALVQIPRIAAAANLSMVQLQNLVNGEITPPLLGFIGPAYVDVLNLDLELLTLEHRSV